MGIKPLLDRVVIEPIEAETKTAGGLYVPENASKEAPTQGKVIAVGPGVRTDTGNYLESLVKEGDTVLFNKFGGTQVELDGTTYQVLNESNILGIIE
ncbi:co-chaperone GroES [bacterium]|nr:co-chaperone GroES [bacterium]